VNLVARAERRLGKPVLTAIQVTMWGAFRAAGVSLGLAANRCCPPNPRR
jgi:hypothetical protein